MYAEGLSCIEIFLRDLKDREQADEIRSKASQVPFAKSAGIYTLRVFIAKETIDSANQFLEIALAFMKPDVPSTSEA